MGVKRQFNDEFKRNAVSMVLEKGMPVKKVAREPDVHPNLIHQWRRQFEMKGDGAFTGKGVKPEDAEIRRLRKELDDVKEERDILKKALGVFSRRSW